MIAESVRKQRESLGFGKNGKLKSASEYMYFNTGIDRNPLLVIYPIRLKRAEMKQTDGVDIELGQFKVKEVNDYIDSRKDELVTGISIGIPAIDGVENIKYTYAMNIVQQRLIHDIDTDSRIIDGDTDND